MKATPVHNRYYWLLPISLIWMNGQQSLFLLPLVEEWDDFEKTCGAVTGGFMVLGMAYGNEDPKDMDTKLFAYRKVRELHHQFEDIHGTTNCKELLLKHATQAQVEERKHHNIICRQLVSEVTGLVYDMLEQKNDD